MFKLSKENDRDNNSFIALVTESGHLFHAANAVLFYLFFNDDVESHPVRATLSGSARYFCGPRALLISSMSRKRWFFPTQKLTKIPQPSD